MESFHCRSREIWYASASEVASDVARSLTDLCNVSITSVGQDAIVIIASCDGCLIRISVEGSSITGMEAASPVVPASIVHVAIEHRGECAVACRRLDLALFRGGG